MALFISIEGGEGVGKTSLGAALADRVTALGAEAVRTFEPGGTPLGAKLRQRLFEIDEPLAPWTETFLFLADRAHHVTQVIRPALARGAVVICDRYADSTLAYQSYGRELDLDLIRAMNRQATGGLMPHLTFFLDLPSQAGIERAHPEPRDRIGMEPHAFHARVLEGFKRIALEEPERIRILDAAALFEEVLETAWASLAPRLERIGYAIPRG